MSAIRFDVIDIRTGKVVNSAFTRASADRSADRLDHAFGAVRHRVQPIYQMIPLSRALETLHCRRITADYSDGMLFDCKSGRDITPIIAGEVYLDMVMDFAA